MNRRCLTAVAAGLTLLACGRSDTFEPTVPVVGPSGPGPDVRLTYNGNQDSWPTWTADGRGILYSFIPVPPGAFPEHRCIGMLPAAGGATIWQLCDDRGVEADSINSFPAYALGGDGQLLYVEAVSRRGAGSAAPSRVTLFLADTAHPFARRTLLTMPITVSGMSVATLADITWTGPTTFYALAQDFTVALHCRGCSALDSLYMGLAVVKGAVSTAGATLTAISGTSGATGYSLAENGATIAFTRRNDIALHKVATTGGTASTVAMATSTGSQLLGVSCRGSTCVVAATSVDFTPIDGSEGYPSIGRTAFELTAVSLSTGAVQLLRTTTAIAATPQVSPVTGDVVAQVGGAFGHIQSIGSSASDLHLFLGLVP